MLTWSILLYAFSALAAGFSTSATMLLILRCTTFIGVCVEFVAAVAWLAELFPDARRREAVLGYTQAFSSVGGLLVTVAYGLCNKYATELPAILGEHATLKRYTLISGVIPASRSSSIRPFLPGITYLATEASRRNAEAALMSQLCLHLSTSARRSLPPSCSRAVTAALFGAIQYTPQIVPGLNRRMGSASQTGQ